MAHDHAHHDHSHAHDHSHGHAGHSHAPDNFGAAFAIGAALNTAFVIAELIFGYAANSLALISDAVHNLSGVIMLTGWLWLDPAISLVIAAVVFWSGWGLARDSVNLALDGVPRGIELAQVRDYLAGLDGVTEVHDLHIWAMSTNETALTAHLVRPGGTDDAFLHGVCEELSHRFNIHHYTMQIEAAAEVCKLAPAERVYATWDWV